MNRKKKRSICLLLLTALVTLSLTGCGQKEKVTGEKVVLNEVAHSIFYAPMYVAIEEGYFAEEGIDLTLVTGFGADKTMTAVLSGEADIGFMGPESTIYTYLGETDDPVINFAQLTASPPWISRYKPFPFTMHTVPSLLYSKVIF